MTFKKAEMAKTLKNGLSMIETNPLNHNWSHFVILSGLTLHQYQKKTAVKFSGGVKYSNEFKIGSSILQIVLIVKIGCEKSLCRFEAKDR